MRLENVVLNDTVSFATDRGQSQLLERILSENKSHKTQEFKGMLRVSVLPVRSNPTKAIYQYNDGMINIQLHGDCIDITNCEFDAYPPGTRFKLDLSNLKHFRSEDVGVLMSVKKYMADDLEIVASITSRAYEKIRQMALIKLLLS